MESPGQIKFGLGDPLRPSLGERGDSFSGATPARTHRSKGPNISGSVRAGGPHAVASAPRST